MYSVTNSDLNYHASAMKLSAALGSKYNVNVVFGGDAKTDGDTITLPHWPMTDPKMRNALYGLVLHEAGGHIRQTHFQMLRSKLGALQGIHIPTWKSLQDILEDVRIETNLLSQFPGASVYLDAAVEVMFRPDRVASISDDRPYWNTVHDWLLVSFRHDLLGQSQLGQMRSKLSGLVRKYLDDDVLAACAEFGRMSSKLSSARTDYAVVLELTDKLYELLISAPLPSTDDDHSQGDADGDHSQGDADRGQEKASDHVGGSSTSPVNHMGDDNQGSRTVDRSPSLNGDEGDLLAQVSKTVEEEFGSLSSLGEIGALTTSEPYSFTISDLESSKFLSMAKNQSSRLLPALSPLIVGEIELDRSSRTGRRIEPKRLCLVKTQCQPTIFSRRHIEEDASVAFSFLVDRSSSTRGAVANDITISTMSIVCALEAFPDVSTSVSHFPAASHKTEPPALSVTKRFDTKLARCVQNWPTSQGDTPLAQALLQAANNLSLVEQQRKFLVVVTDGKPNDKSAALSAKNIVSGLNIEVLGIVITQQAYPDIFDASICINSSSELPVALRELVLRAI